MRFLRAMRGEARACLIEGDDGFAYVVKLTNNPQGGRRVLVNEFIGSILLTQLGVATPERAFVNIDDDHMGDINNPLPKGTHFGSRYPGTPDAIAVYDFLPDALLRSLHNRGHFLGALVFDQWVSNIDARQTIFFRQPAIPTVPSTQASWVTQMIDNGSIFAGRDWTLRVSAVQGIYGRSVVYGSDLSMRACEPWLHVLLKLKFDVLNRAIAELPPDWIQGDEQALARLLVRLYERRLRIPAMVEQAVLALRTRGSLK
jgi:hypothetical protein